MVQNYSDMLLLSLALHGRMTVIGDNCVTGEKKIDYAKVRFIAGLDFYIYIT